MLQVRRQSAPQTVLPAALRVMTGVISFVEIFAEGGGWIDLRSFPGRFRRIWRTIDESEVSTWVLLHLSVFLFLLNGGHISTFGDVFEWISVGMVWTGR